MAFRQAKAGYPLRFGGRVVLLAAGLLLFSGCGRAGKEPAAAAAAADAGNPDPEEPVSRPVSDPGDRSEADEADEADEAEQRAEIEAFVDGKGGQEAYDRLFQYPAFHQLSESINLDPENARHVKLSERFDQSWELIASVAAPDTEFGRSGYGEQPPLKLKVEALREATGFLLRGDAEGYWNFMCETVENAALQLSLDPEADVPVTILRDSSGQIGK